MRKTWETSLNPAIAAVTGLAFALIAAERAAAQEKCQESIRGLPENSTYTQQLMIDVGDIPGHQVRVVEVHRTHPNAEANCEGLKLVESWDRGVTDYINTNGTGNGYTINVFDNGDKSFQRWSGIAHAVDNSDGSRTITFTGTYTYTGGTGVYAGIQGMGRSSCRFDPLKNYNECTSEGEYWLK